MSRIRDKEAGTGLKRESGVGGVQVGASFDCCDIFDEFALVRRQRREGVKDGDSSRVRGMDSGFEVLTNHKKGSPTRVTEVHLPRTCPKSCPSLPPFTSEGSYGHNAVRAKLLRCRRKKNNLKQARTKVDVLVSFLQVEIDHADCQ